MKAKHLFTPAFLLILAGIILLTVTTCKKKNEDTGDNRPVFTNGQGTVGPSGGIITISDNSSPINGVKIDIPAGALKENHEIQLTLAPDSILSLLGSSGLAIAIKPEGLLFEMPFQLTFPLTGTPTLESTRVFYINADSNQVTQLSIDQLNTTNKTVMVSCNHFSNFCVNQDDGVWAKMDMYYVNGKIGANVYFYWRSKTGIDHGLLYVPTSAKVRMTFGPMYTKQFIDNNCFLITCPDLYENFELSLKEKDYQYEWLNPTKGTKKIVVKRIGTAPSNLGAEVYLNQYMLYSSSLQTSDDREAFFQGKALYFQFEFTPDQTKEYYLVARWLIADRTDWHGIYLNHVTAIYSPSNYDFRLNTSHMITQNMDQNNDYVVDAYESGNQAPSPPSDPSPTNNATNVSIPVTLTWICTDPNEDPLSYDIYFGTSNDPPLIATNQTQIFYILSGLTHNSKYYWKIVAKDNHGHSTPSSIWSFTTTSGGNPTKPTVTTATITNKTQTSVTSGGNVTSDGGATVTAKGICWSTSINPTISNHPISGGSGTGTYTCNITGLSPTTTYHVRAYATNSVGTSYGDDVPFTTNGSTALTTNLIGYWKIDETSGSIVHDSYGSNDCTVQDGVTINESGLINRAASFIETSGGLTTGKTASQLGIGGEASKSVSLWIKADNSINGLDSPGIINLGSTSNQQQFGIKYYGGGPAYWMFDSYYGAVRIGPDNDKLDDGSWHHIVVTYTSGTHTIRTYLDGALVTEDSTYVISVGEDAGFSIGIGSQGNYTGAIDEVGLWSRVLTDNEVLQLYNNGNGLPYPF